MFNYCIKIKKTVTTMASCTDFAETVPPMEQLLACGTPNISALETYIADLDVDLEENAREYVFCLASVLS